MTADLFDWEKLESLASRGGWKLRVLVGLFQVASDPGKTSHRAVKVTLLEMAPREDEEDKSGPAAGGATSGAAAKGKSRNFRRGKRRPANKESSS